MKVQLERTLANVPSNLTCSACASEFKTSRIRALLCHDDGQIHGDLCPSCVKAGATSIQRQLQKKAAAALKRHVAQQSFSQSEILAEQPVTLATYRQALIDQEVATSPITLPRFYHWWWKWLQIHAQETQELEKARTGSAGCECRKSKAQLRILFQSDSSPN